MRILYYIVFISSYLLVSCNNSNHNTSTVSIDKEDVEDKVVNIKNQDSIEILSKIKNMSVERLNTVLNTNYFRNNYLLRISKNYESKSADIYAVKLVNDNIPNNIKKDYLVIDNKNKQFQYIISLEINQVFNYDGTIMFGGFYNYREYEYYMIYKIQNDIITNEFDSRNVNGNSIIVGYYKDDECIDYRPDRFTFHYDTQIKEIVFKGFIDNYCTEVVDRFSNSVIDRKYETIIYFSYTKSQWIYQSSKSRYYFW